MARKHFARVFVGDVGEIPVRKAPQGVPNLESLANLTFRELCNVAIECGVRVQDLIGVDVCYKHVGKILLRDNAMPKGFNLFDHCTYCRNCFQLFRLRELPKED